VDITNYILSKTNKLERQPEEYQIPPGFEMYNTGGVEVEVGEFLYSFVRMAKPDLILETGTHLGISSVYMALACQRNKRGKVLTYEVLEGLRQEAQALWIDVDVANEIDSVLKSSLDVSLDKDVKIDILFLDSEPQYRFAEFEKFWPNLRDGGFIFIHDLDHHMAHHGMTYHDVYDWPYGDFRESLGPYMKSLKVQSIALPNPRGMMFFQKARDNFAFLNHMKGII
jgi:predicted O-methyltransferase YrrM